MIREYILMFIRYGFTGVIATAFHYLVLLCLVELFDIRPWIATGIGAMLGAAVAYIGNRNFTFSSNTPNFKALPRFMIVAVLGAILNSLQVWILTHFFDMHYFVAQVIATTVVLIVTYQLNRQWTFA